MNFKITSPFLYYPAIVFLSSQKYSLLKTKILRQRTAATIKVTKDCLFKQYSENKIIYTGKLNFKRVFHSKIKRVVVPKQGGTLFCITKRKKTPRGKHKATLYSQNTYSNEAVPSKFVFNQKLAQLCAAKLYK